MTGIARCLQRGAAAASLVACLAWGGGGHAQSSTSQSSETRPAETQSGKPHSAKTQSTNPKTHAPRHPKAPVTAAATPPPPAENLVVHGARRYETAPVPNQAIHDPADAMRDPATGAPIGRFGHAYLDANPVPPVNPELQGDQGPVAVGVQR